MSKSDYLESAILALIFNATAIANIADDAGTDPLTDLYLSLHTADPGDDGDQETSECDYVDYTRVAITRDNTGFTVVDGSVSLAADTDFPEAGTATTPQTATHFGIGTDETGGGNLLYSGPLSPNIAIVEGVTPRLKDTTTITES